MMKRLQMKFKGASGKAYTMSVQHPKEGHDADAVNNAFANIVTKKLIVNKDGSEVNAMDGAKIITTSTEVLF
ncbi:MAG: DUF2922 domain-containing protein [Fenollaria timonensis]